MTIVFVNTRAQGELLFQALWKINTETLPIAVHHGSLDIVQRRRVEAAMAEGRLRAVVATSSLDLGIDWGGVDQVIQVGRAQRGQPPAATGGPRQPPHGRGQQRDPGAGQPLRAAGVRGRHRRRGRPRAGRRPAPARRPGRAGPAFAADGRRRPVRPRRHACGNPSSRALCRPVADRFRRRAGLRRGRRLRPVRLRPLPQAVPRRRRADAHPRRRHRPHGPHEPRHDRRSAIVEGPLRRARRRRPGRGRGKASSTCSPRATPSCSPGACCASCGCARPPSR